MGSGASGGIERHLEALKTATLAWLEYENLSELPEEERELKLIEFAESGDMPEQPEPLAILRRLRRFNTMMYSGGYIAQPYILMRELNTVIEAEIEYERLRLLNQQIRRQALEEQAKNAT